MKCPNCNVELKLVGDSREIHTSNIELQHTEIKKSIDEDYGCKEPSNTDCNCEVCKKVKQSYPEEFAKSKENEQ